MMREIVQTLKTGNSRERLAVISDIATILGVSVFAILSPYFGGLSHQKINMAVLIAAYCLFFVAAQIAIFFGVAVLQSWLRNWLQPTGLAAGIYFALWLVWVAWLILSTLQGYTELLYTKW
jgi:glucan phosphoethanolaminetransferase (alkaline phosphatase superfamily)